MKLTHKILVLVGALGIFSVGCDRSPEGIANKIVKKVSSELDLNETQRGKLEKIKLAMLEERKERQNRIETHKDKFKQIVLSDKLDKTEIKSIMKDHSNRFEGKFEKHFPLFQDFHASLNPEQKKKLVEMAEKLHNKRKKYWR